MNTRANRVAAANLEDPMYPKVVLADGTVLKWDGAEWAVLVKPIFPIVHHCYNCGAKLVEEP